MGQVSCPGVRRLSPEGYRKMFEVETKEWKVLEKVPRSVRVGFRK